MAGNWMKDFFAGPSIYVHDWSQIITTHSLLLKNNKLTYPSISQKYPKPIICSGKCTFYLETPWILSSYIRAKWYTGIHHRNVSRLNMYNKRYKLACLLYCHTFIESNWRKVNVLESRFFQFGKQLKVKRMHVVYFNHKLQIRGTSHFFSYFFGWVSKQKKPLVRIPHAVTQCR